MVVGYELFILPVAIQSYVLRYAGLLDEAGKECDAALTADPGFSVFRSCATPFILSGDYAQADKYIRLDENTGFGAMLRMEIALRTGNTKAAMEESRMAMQAGGVALAQLIHSCLEHAPDADLSKQAAELEADPRWARDSEILYRNAAALSFCGQPQERFGY